MNGYIEERKKTLMNGLRNRCNVIIKMDGWMDGRTDERTDGRTDVWMDGCLHACMDSLDTFYNTVQY